MRATTATAFDMPAEWFNLPAQTVKRDPEDSISVLRAAVGIVGITSVDQRIPFHEFPDPASESGNNRAAQRVHDRGDHRFHRSRFPDEAAARRATV